MSHVYWILIRMIWYYLIQNIFFFIYQFKKMKKEKKKDRVGPSHRDSASDLSVKLLSTKKNSKIRDSTDQTKRTISKKKKKKKNEAHKAQPKKLKLYDTCNRYVQHNASTKSKSYLPFLSLLQPSPSSSISHFSDFHDFQLQ